MVKQPFPVGSAIKQFFDSPPTLRYLPRAFGYMLGISMLQPIHLLDLLVNQRKIERYEPEHPPVIVLGFWRSGTTYLQRLLCQDPGNTFLRQYDSFFALGNGLHRSLLKRPVNAFFKGIGMKHPIHKVPMDMDFPSEEDIALVASGYLQSPMWSHLFPRSADEIIDRHLIYKPGTPASDRWVDMYRYFVKRLAFFEKGKPVVLKSPCNTAKVPQLLEAFPNAKFIYIERDPREAYFSNMKLLRSNKGQWLQPMPEEQMKEVFMTCYSRVMPQYYRTRHLIPEENLVELRFEELCANPSDEIRNAYQQFGMELSPEYEKVLKTFLGRNHEKHRHFYPKDLPDDIKKMIRHTRDKIAHKGDRLLSMA